MGVNSCVGSPMSRQAPTGMWPSSAVILWCDVQYRGKRTPVSAGETGDIAHYHSVRYLRGSSQINWRVGMASHKPKRSDNDYCHCYRRPCKTAGIAMCSIHDLNIMILRYYDGGFK